jgi:hypothetical protein
MRCLQAGSGLQAYGQGLVEREGAARSQNIGQQLASQILHDYVDESGCLTYLIDGRDVQMLDLDCLPDLLLQA